MINTVIWCNDLSENSGEGKLARKFISKYFSKKKKLILRPISNFSILKYLNFILGIIFLWFWFFKNKKTVYINYLPLWNCLIFLLVPPNTIFGPITGSLQINKINGTKSFIRFYIFPLLYRISLYLINKRSEKIIFGSNILYKLLSKKIKKKSKINFVLNDFKFKKFKKKRKMYDFIIYFRSHENKFFEHHKKLIKEKLKIGKRILVVGDKINIKGVNQLQFVNKKKLHKLIKDSDFVISGDDNLLSFFNLECLQYKLKIICNYKLLYQLPVNLKKYFIPYNFEKRKYL